MIKKDERQRGGKKAKARVSFVKKAIRTDFESDKKNPGTFFSYDS